MRLIRPFSPAIAGCLLIALPIVTTAEQIDGPARTEPEARRLAALPAVDAAIEDLLEQTLAGASGPALIQAMQRIRADSAQTPPQRDAILHGYIERLRDYYPDTAPSVVLDWLSEAAPLAVIGHEEGAHHPVALFNVSAAARGLANEWAWRSGYQAVSGTNPLPLPILARELGGQVNDKVRRRGMRYAIARLPAERLDVLAMHCASSLAGCGAARADIELARGNLDWLKRWLARAPASAITPRLRQARNHLSPASATQLMQAALGHPNKGIAAWAMSDLTAHLPKDGAVRLEWGMQLLQLLGDPELGGAAALQLVRMGGDWLEAANARPAESAARRRLELIAELETTLPAAKPESEAER